MGFGGALLAISAVKGITSIGQGFAQSAEDKYNATTMQLQAQQIGIQGQIEQGQLTTQGGQIMAKSTATAGAAGVEPTGSVAAVMLHNQTQIETDKAIAAYNTTTAQNAALDKAKMLNQQAGQSVFSGFSSAFSDLLTGATQNYAYNKSINTGQWSFAPGGSFSNTSFTGQ